MIPVEHGRPTGGRRLGPWVTAISERASGESAWFLLGLPGAAYAAGFEAGVRAGQAAPGHHDGGWHLTGTLGSIAAGAAAAHEESIS